MLPETELRRVADGTGLRADVAAHYLTTYVGECEGWENHLATLGRRINDRDKLRKAISFAILLPARDRSTRIDPENPQNLLFRAYTWSQFPEKDWYAEFGAVVKKDLEIRKWREKALRLGVINQIEMQPFCRQAYNWIYQNALETGAITPENKSEMERRFRNIVLVYGGAVLSYLFTNHKNIANKILNWRSVYFVERAVFEAYTIDQVVKIKQAELDRTNEKWIKKLSVSN